jgi:hypothetical protein
MLKKRLPVNYKPKKHSHLVYYDIENINTLGTDDINGLNVKGLVVACHKKYQTIYEKLISLLSLKKGVTHHIDFKQAEKDKADEFLLNSFKHDLRYFEKVPNLIFVMMTKDKGLQKKFVDVAIDKGLDFQVFC